MLTTKPNLRGSIAVPLTTGLLVLLGVFVSLLYLGEQRYTRETRNRDRLSVERYFSRKLQSDAQLMRAAGEALTLDSELRSAFLSGDRDRLARVAENRFEYLKRSHRITHMYFIAADRVTRLRMHRPEQFGDTIPRWTLLTASRTGRPVSGLELGRLRGLLTLRVVIPWHHQGHTIGFIELGEEIQHVAAELKGVLDVDLYIAVRKELVDRASWEAGMRLFGRVPHWDQFPNEALIDQTSPVPAELARYFTLPPAARPELLDVRRGEKRLMGAALPLMDAQARQVGEIVFLRDRTALATSTHRAFFASILLVLLVGLICALLFYQRVHSYFITPLLELRTVAERAGRGELSQIVVERRRDEMGDLARSINRMIADLRAAQAEQTRLILDAALDAVATFDQKGRIIDWNHAAETLFGWSRNAAIGQNILELLGASEARGPIERALEHYNDSGASGLFNRLIEERVQRRDGASVPVEMAITPVSAASGLFFSAFFRDISDRKRLESDLQAAQRLEAIGKLAGGIAHDFNNLITAIIGYVEAVQEALPPDSAAYEDANEIRRAADRATQLVHQLLDFARKRLVQPRIIDLNQLVVGIERMLRRLIGENVQLTTVLDRGIWPVLADPGQIEQVLVNLAVNARDAMPDGGHLTVQTSNVVISGAVTLEGAVPPGSYVVLSVSDSGEGMDEAVLAHIFEPFYTTKQQGRGTGLGLASCYGIVKQAGGFIRVTSAKGKGTTFRIYLPKSEQAAPAEQPAPLSGIGRKGHETILLAEDEHQVRKLIERALRQQGYRILPAINGADAVRVSRETPGPIHLLLTDVVMPEMGGREAAAMIRGERPDVRVIYMSGYSEELVRMQGEMNESSAFIAKPFAPDELRRVIRDVLDARATAGALAGELPER